MTSWEEMAGWLAKVTSCYLGSFLLLFIYLFFNWWTELIGFEIRVFNILFEDVHDLYNFYF